MIQRYRPEYCGYAPTGGMEKAEDGEWVRIADHLAALAERDKAIAAVVADYNRAASTEKYNENRWAEFGGVGPLLPFVTGSPPVAERGVVWKRGTEPPGGLVRRVLGVRPDGKLTMMYFADGVWCYDSTGATVDTPPWWCELQTPPKEGT